jgi:hypothetical protein
VGTRHVLFPRSLTFGAQLHPSSAAGCQFPDAALVCMDDCKSVPTPQRSRPSVSPPSALLGETSQPGVHTLASVLLWTRSDASERSASEPFPQGRHRDCRSRSFAPRHGSCLLPLKLLYALIGRPRFRDLPWFGSYCDSAVIAGLPAPSNRLAQSAMIRSFFTLRVRRRNDAAADFVRPKPPDCGPPRWLTVATSVFD